MISLNGCTWVSCPCGVQDYPSTARAFALCRIRDMGEIRITRVVERILLAMISDPARPMYGLELSRLAHLKSGTLYPALARLEAAGLVTSEWEDGVPSEAERPMRRYYRLTGEGATAARSIQAELRGLERLRVRPT